MQIPARFNGPPASGNGGWSAGAFAAEAGARVGGPAVEVTLRVPPPLDIELQVAGGAVHAGETLVAELGAADGELVPVGPADVARAGPYPGFARHPFPTCYVCGPDRPDGLRIFPGPLPDGGMAASWVAPADVAFPTVWAALDCPGGWTALSEGRVYLLGRIAARVDRLPEPGASCVVVARPGARSGRKALVDTTAYAPDGQLIGTARATWIALS
jgi:hypothetical protein